MTSRRRFWDESSSPALDSALTFDSNMPRKNQAAPARARPFTQPQLISKSRADAKEHAHECGGAPAVGLEQLDSFAGRRPHHRGVHDAHARAEADTLRARTTRTRKI